LFLLHPEKVKRSFCFFPCSDFLSAKLHRLFLVFVVAIVDGRDENGNTGTHQPALISFLFASPASSVREFVLRKDFGKDFVQGQKGSLHEITLK
jgi:hypothetical protein